MLLAQPNRKKTFVVVAFIALLIAISIVVLLLWVPSKVRARARAAAERRGLTLAIGDVSFGFGSVTLADLRAAGPGLMISIDEVRGQGPAFAMLTDGASALTQLELDGVYVRADVSDDEVDGTLSSLRGHVNAAAERTEQEGERAEADNGRQLIATSVVFELLDEHGRLALATGAGSLRGDEIHAALETLSFGAEEGHSGALMNTRMSVARAESGALQLARLSVGGGAMTWAVPAQNAGFTPSSDEEDPDELTPEAPSDLGGEEADDENEDVEDAAPESATDESATDESAADESAADESDAVASDDTFGRLKRAARTLRGTTRSAGEQDAEDDGRPFYLRRVAEDVMATVENLNVMQRTDDGVASVLNGFSSSIEGKGEGVFRLRGDGHTRSDGSLSWDLLVTPAEANGEGTIAFEKLPLALVTPALPALPWHQPENAQLDGQLTVESRSAAEVRAQGNVTLRNGALSSERIAPNPVYLGDIGLEGRARWVPSIRRLEVEEAHLTAGRARVHIVGSMEDAPDHYLIDMTATLPATSCSDAVGAIPDDLMGDIAGFAWVGRFGARVAIDVDSRDLDSLDLKFQVADGCRFSMVPAPADLRRVRSTFTHRVVEPDGSVFSMRAGPGSGNWSSIHSISPFMSHAVIAHEDGAFLRHSGFSRGAIRDSLVRNLQAGRYVRGASTITMQLAKNLFLQREKTLARKVQEVILTWWLESALAKKDILELYLNVIEYGPGIYGIRNATNHYFGHDPAFITPAEASFLACVLPNPKRFHEAYNRGTLTGPMLNRTRRFLRHMASRGRISRGALSHGLAQLESFRFHRAGQPPTSTSTPPGAARLPFATPGAFREIDPITATNEDPAPAAP